MLILLTSGMITTTIVVYIATGTLLMLKGISGVLASHQAKKDYSLYNEIRILEDDTPWVTRSNIIASSVIHLVLISLFLGSTLAFVAVLLGAIFRILESFSLEKLFNAKINPLH